MTFHADPSATARLLLIEDDPDQQELLADTLETQFGAGCTTVAGSRAEAFVYDFNAFDLILTDFNLPDATGLDILRDIRDTSMTPVLMVTGENNDEYATRAIELGAIDYIVKTHDYIDTVPLVVRKCLAMCRVRSRQETDHQQTVNRLQADLAESEHAAATDAMTGLYNRRAFGNLVSQIFADSKRHGQVMSAVMLDMDRFKQLNDTLGHATGDDMIRLCGRSIRRNLRQMDVAARYGGDEFVIIFPQTRARIAAQIMQRLRDEFWNDTLAKLGPGHGMTMSIGIADLGQTQADTAQELIEAADAALYRAKHAGRDCIQGPDFHMPRTNAA